jgi:perosamine synthetase
MSSDTSTGPDIPLSVPCMGGNEITYLTECVETGWVSSVGKFVDRFEENIACHTQSPHAVATSSGTAALHIALILAGIRPGDLVLVSDLTFIAPVNAITYVGAEPLLVDASETTWQMDVDRIEAFLSEDCVREEGNLIHRQSRQRIGGIVAVHVLGLPVPMPRLLEIAGQHDLPVIEDAAEGLGSSLAGRPLGSWAEIGCLSFNGNKIMTTGGGGMILSSSETHARRARHLTTQAKSHPVEYYHDEIGYNYRLNNLQAAFGVAQLEQLDHFVRRRKEIHRWYREHLSDLEDVGWMPIPSEADCNCWLSTIRVPGGSRPLQVALSERGIQSRPLWQPMHQTGAHHMRSILGGSVSDQLFQECLSLPSSPNLTDAELIRIVDAVRDALPTSKT